MSTARRTPRQGRPAHDPTDAASARLVALVIRDAEPAGTDEGRLSGPWCEILYRVRGAVPDRRAAAARIWCEAHHDTCGGEAMGQAIDRAMNESSLPDVAEPALQADLPPVLPFPVGIFPDPVQGLIREVAESIGCPPDFAAVAVLGVAAGVIGRSVNLRLKDGYFAITVMWIAQIGMASDGKSPANEIIAEAIRRIVTVLRVQNEAALARWREEAERPGPDGKKPSTPPPKPIPRRLRVDDVTSEKLEELLAENPRGLVQILDEVVSYTTSMNQYKGGKGSDRAAACKRWSGLGTIRDRIGRDSTGGDRTNHVVFGGMVPDMLGELAESKGRADGFLERFLVTYPDQRPVPEWTEQGVSDTTLDDWCEIISRLWARPMRDIEGQMVPHVATFTSEGKACWVAGYNHHVAEMNRSDFPPSIRSAWGKYREYAGRFAAVLACLWHAADPTADPTDVPFVDTRDATNAWELINYFKSHTFRVRAAMDRRLGPDAESLLQALRDAPDGLTRDKIRGVSSGHWPKSRTDEILNKLANSGLAYRRIVATGGRNAERWIAGPDPCAKSAESAKSPGSGVDTTLIALSAHTAHARMSDPGDEVDRKGA